MNTKQIIDLCSFVAMVARMGYDEEKVNEWIASQNLPTEVSTHLHNTLTPRTDEEYIALIWDHNGDRYYSRQIASESFSDFKKRVYDSFGDSYHIEIFLAHPKNK